jgi:hypothetical protein
MSRTPGTSPNRLIKNWDPQENGGARPQGLQVVKQLKLTVNPPTAVEVEAMHITGDVVTLTGIWFLTLYGGPKFSD